MTLCIPAVTLLVCCGVLAAGAGAGAGGAGAGAAPVISIYTDKADYYAYDVMHVGLRILNDVWREVCLKIWLELPSGDARIIANFTVTLPPLSYNNPTLLSFTLPPLESGTYTWHASLSDESGVLCEDSAVWRFLGAKVEGWAVLVGIADYVGWVNDLEYADDDALDMRAALVNGGWRDDHIRLLLDDEADKPEIVAALLWLAANADPDDIALFFFSGHGTCGADMPPPDEADGYDEYLCTHELAGIRDDELAALLDGIKARTVVIIDSCFSGGMARQRRAKTLADEHVALKDGFDKDVAAENRVVLAACDADEYSYEYSFLKNGVFTFFVVRGLEGYADADGDDHVSAEECFSFASPRVRYLTSLSQNPRMFDGYEGELELVVV
ncbi:MAG: caspase family protein [Candidatus Alkanophagales archaeon]